MAKVRANGVFTTHTPVPAGHDTFSTEQIDHTLGHYWEAAGIDRETFLSFGAPPGEEPGHLPYDRLRHAPFPVRERRGREARPGHPGELGTVLARDGSPKRFPSSTSPTGSTSPPGWRGG